LIDFPDRKKGFIATAIWPFFTYKGNNRLPPTSSAACFDIITPLETLCLPFFNINKL
jgi:hypothetical protein